MIEKTCCHCKETKSATEFYQDARRRDGLRSRCKRCTLSGVIGIYQITGPGNKVYIGSSINIHKRWSDHIKALRHNRHDSRHMQNAFNKYGESSLTFTIVEVVAEPSMLVQAEQRWLDALFQSRDVSDIYNTSQTAGSILGVRHTDQARANMSVAQQKVDRTMSEEQRRYLSNLNKGKRPSSETLAKIKAAFTPERRRAISERMRGRVWTEEQRQKQSQSRRGKKFTEEHRRKIAEASKKHRHSDETKAKLCERAQHRTEEYRMRIAISKSGGKRYTIVAPDGTTYTDVINLRGFAIEHGLSTVGLYQVLSGRQRLHKGWSVSLES